MFTSISTDIATASALILFKSTQILIDMFQLTELKLIRREGRITLAIHAYKGGYFTRVREATKAYDLPHLTLEYRVQGHSLIMTRFTARKQNTYGSRGFNSYIMYIIDRK